MKFEEWIATCPSITDIAFARFVWEAAQEQMALESVQTEAASSPIARVEKTPVGPALWVCGVKVHWWLGTIHDYAIDKMAAKINAAACVPSPPAKPTVPQLGITFCAKCYDHEECCEAGKCLTGERP